MKCSSCGQPLDHGAVIVYTMIGGTTAATVVFHFRCAISISRNVDAISALSNFATAKGWVQPDLPFSKK